MMASIQMMANGEVEEPDEDSRQDDNEDNEAGPSSLGGSSLSTGTKRRRPPANANQPPITLIHPLWNKLAAIVRDEWKGDPKYVANATSPEGMSAS